MQNIRLDGKITLLTPLSHIGESVGPDSFLSEDVILTPDGTLVECFTYSGNAFRGILRDLAALHFTKKLGLIYDLSSFYLLFSGGALENGHDLDLDLAIKLREFCPVVSLFGGAFKSHILRGKLKVGPMYPIVRETVRVVPSFLRTDVEFSWKQLTYDKAYTRTDDLKNVNLSRFVKRGSISSREGEDPQQMRYVVELLVPGTTLYQRIDLEDLTEIELGVFVTALTEFAQAPYIGGKSSIGCGLVDMEYYYRLPGKPEPEGVFFAIKESVLSMSDIAQEVKEKYHAFLEEIEKKYLSSEEVNEFKQCLGVIGRAVSKN